MVRRVVLLWAVAAAPGAAVAQQPPTAGVVAARVRAWREAHEADILRELVTLLAIPNVASDRPNIRRNADHLLTLLARRGMEARLIENDDAPPAVYGELRTPGAARTVVFYAHYDGQPVDPARWRGDAWRPVLRDRPLAAGGDSVPIPVAGAARFDPEARLYGRSASDDKSPIVALLAALDALRAAGVSPSVNLKVFLEGEEEAGSPNVRRLLERHAELLRADAWIFGDGPVHQTRRPQVVFGARGVIGAQLTVYGPARSLHSGHYGNWAPNPNVLLAHLIASLRDVEGRILIPGYYDDVRAPTAADRAAVAAMPPVDSALRAELLLARTEADNAPVMERVLLPALNVDGLEGGRTGDGAANAIPTESRAYLDFRLVPAQTPQRVRELVEAHLVRQGFFVTHQDPDSVLRMRERRIVKLVWVGGYPATRTAMDLPVSRAVSRIVAEAAGGPIVEVPMLGGSLPLNDFAEVTGVPLIVLPIVNHDNNQHAANENLRLKNLWDGIEIYAALLARLGVEWRGVP